jgi:hypothetical protein
MDTEGAFQVGGAERANCNINDLVSWFLKGDGTTQFGW